MERNLCVHCEQPIVAGEHHAFAYPASGYLAHAGCISVLNWAQMDQALTRHYARARVARITTTTPTED